MREFIKTIHIDAPSERVWAVMSDVEHWHEWTASITRIDIRGGGPLHVGSQVTIRQPKFPPAIWNVTSFISEESFTWTSSGPGVLVTADHKIVAANNAWIVTLRLQFDGLLSSIFAALTTKINDRYMTMEAEGLRKRCESD
jgi:hypothetical protein